MPMTPDATVPRLEDLLKRLAGTERDDVRHP
jgi:hypothetical protein